MRNKVEVGKRVYQSFVSEQPFVFISVARVVDYQVHLTSNSYKRTLRLIYDRLNRERYDSSCQDYLFLFYVNVFRYAVSISRKADILE